MTSKNPLALLAFVSVFVFGLSLDTAFAQASGAPTPDAAHQNARCLCKCPDVALVAKDTDDNVLLDLGSSTRRSVYINSSVTPQQCSCESVVLIHLNLTTTQADSFCPRCKCDYQIRNLSIIKVVVILVIWVISILIIYMGFLACLDPILNRRLAGMNYREQRNISHDEEETEEEHEAVAGASGENSTPMSTYGSSVINRVGHQTTRWKKQVQEQRKNIYDRHSMLN